MLALLATTFLPGEARRATPLQRESLYTYRSIPTRCSSREPPSVSPLCTYSSLTRLPSGLASLDYAYCTCERLFWSHTIGRHPPQYDALYAHTTASVHTPHTFPESHTHWRQTATPLLVCSHDCACHRPHPRFNRLQSPPLFVHLSPTVFPEHPHRLSLTYCDSTYTLRPHVTVGAS
ncbi:hypothetical protein CRENBAI_008419 [Crenichthys baileyi]|uniref:Uncharacterized protein n=1 Tax=Crenichthys baileyi TaxID=28760 RepID=A0AAV9RFE7_9TELE